VDDLGGDESALEVSVDDTRGSGGLVTLDDGPCAGLLDAGGDIGGRPRRW